MKGRRKGSVPFADTEDDPSLMTDPRYPGQGGYGTDPNAYEHDEEPDRVQLVATTGPDGRVTYVKRPMGGGQYGNGPKSPYGRGDPNDGWDEDGRPIQDDHFKTHGKDGGANMNMGPGGPGSGMGYSKGRPGPGQYGYQPGDPGYGQDDHLLEQEGYGAGGQGKWGKGYSTTTTTTTTKRTIVGPDGENSTVEYKTEKDGVVETRIERKIVISSEGDDIDHDEALAAAIRSVTDMNPDLSVEKIEIQTKSETDVD